MVRTGKCALFLEDAHFISQEFKLLWRFNKGILRLKLLQIT